MPFPVPPEETRGLDQLREQLEVERELARRLLEAPREARPRLYAEVYDELVRRVPHQPMLRQKEDPAARAALVRLETLLLEPFLTPEAVFLEIGSGDCSLGMALAPRLEEAIAVEASAEMVRGLEAPEGFRLIVGEAPPYAIEAGSVDLAFSSHVIEHLHPDDAAAHAEEMLRVLRPGGRYVCVTPNRLHGPHDVSRYFADEPQGLHLREYTHTSLARLLRQAGFGRVEVLRGIGRPSRRAPLLPHRLSEAVLGGLPLTLRRRLLASLGGRPPFRPLEQVKLVATA